MLVAKTILWDLQIAWRHEKTCKAPPSCCRIRQAFTYGGVGVSPFALEGGCNCSELFVGVVSGIGDKAKLLKMVLFLVKQHKKSHKISDMHFQKCLKFWFHLNDST